PEDRGGGGFVREVRAAFQTRQGFERTGQRRGGQPHSGLTLSAFGASTAKAPCRGRRRSGLTGSRPLASSLEAPFRHPCLQRPRQGAFAADAPLSNTVLPFVTVRRYCGRRDRAACSAACVGFRRRWRR